MMKTMMLFIAVGLLVNIQQSIGANDSDNRVIFSENESVDTVCSFTEKDTELTLNCSDQNLSYIPYYNSNYTGIMFENNNLVNVTAETFSNVTCHECLQELRLFNNKIHNISANALDSFSNMKILDLSKNPIFYDNLKHVLESISKLKHLKHLQISGIPTITINANLFSLIKPNDIEILKCSNYTQKNVSIDIFSKFNKLKILYLSHNQMTEIQFSKHIYLEVLIIDHNSLYFLPDFSVAGNTSECFFPNLKALDISANFFSELDSGKFECLRKLKFLAISENPINIIHNNIFSYLLELSTLRMLRMSAHLLIEPYAFNSTSLSNLKIECGNKNASELFMSLEDTFKFSPNLEVLQFFQINMYHMTREQLFKFFYPLRKLVMFKCFRCGIFGDPRKYLYHLRSVRNLNLEDNHITLLHANTFKYNTELDSLNLRYNDIESVQESDLLKTFLGELSVLDLSMNKFICDCGIEWLVTWLKNKQKSRIPRLPHYPKDYTCTYPIDKRNSLIQFTYRKCHPWSPGIWAAVIGSPVVVVVAFVASIVYKKRWNIKHYIYLLRKRRNYEAIDGRNFVYDAFVAYESEESTWVRRTLVPKLENEVGLKLCIHERDFRAGVFISDNIVENMNASDKIVLILTNSFARNGWCMFELKVAHSKLIEEGTELVVIMLERIDAGNMNNYLKVLLRITPYIEWTEDVSRQDLFWNKLKDAFNK